MRRRKLTAHAPPRARVSRDSDRHFVYGQSPISGVNADRMTPHAPVPRKTESWDSRRSIVKRYRMVILSKESICGRSVEQPAFARPPHTHPPSPPPIASSSWLA